MKTYEDARATLEELELIENAVASRLRRNPEIFYRNIDEIDLVEHSGRFDHIPLPQKSANKVYAVKKSRRSRKQILAQEHEIESFLSQFFKHCKSLRQVEFDVSEYRVDDGSTEKLLKHIDAIKEGPSEDSHEFRDDYAMFSSSTPTNKNILSRKAQNLDINSYFTRDEQYGEYLDLDSFHQRWLSVVKNGDVTFLQFLSEVEKFTDQRYLLQPAINRNSSRYKEFVAALHGYMSGYAARAFPLLSWDMIHAKAQEDFHLVVTKPVPSGESGLFCIPCDKHFKAVTVYNAHLPGKRHVSNLRKHITFLSVEHSLHIFCRYLAKELAHTREFVERKLAFTAEERAQELERLTDVYNSPVYGSQEQEDVPENENEEAADRDDSAPDPSLNLPLGPDGFPIPYWLYKLQGLDIEYPCELCGNFIYNGRRQFDKHFGEQRHVFGLRRLGIEPSASFKGVTKIDDAKQLWSHLRSTSSGRGSPEAKLEVEVEDDDGNVMSKKVYDELKKQGLI
ncbi:LAQU0S03e07206g1_1 [Lachancea quebecensis]|uniref:LAQU0S03e07206g1_1 n=1 Tax=Lachancea quebecensis TaxID=1654605 RepID=A0A0P1KPR1_9SACH|nr:LAQU0S03e07206g1_1 [Lachancea quebecensis]